MGVKFSILHLIALYVLSFFNLKNDIKNYLASVKLIHVNYLENRNF